MSRIHEALKRAEQERAASQGGRVDSAPVMDLPASPEPLPGMAEAADATRTAPTAPLPGAPGNGQKVPSFATSFTFDTLLARSAQADWKDRKSTRLNSSHANISYAVFCLKKKNTARDDT